MIDLSFVLAMAGAMLLLLSAMVGWYAIIKPRQRLRMEREHHRRKRQGR